MNKKLTFILGLTLAVPHTASAVSYKLIGAGLMGAGGSAYAAAHVLMNKWNINSKRKKLEQPNFMQDAAKGGSKIYNWRISVYPTARTVKPVNRIQFAKELIEDALYDNIHSFDTARFANGQELTVQRVKEIIAALKAIVKDEKEELKDYFSFLKPYVSPYGDLKRDKWLTVNLFGVDYGAKLTRACTLANDADRLDPALWNPQQEQAIDAFMKSRAVTSFKKFMRGNANYGNAAQLYWETYKKRARLNEIEKALDGELNIDAIRRALGGHVPHYHGRRHR